MFRALTALRTLWPARAGRSLPSRCALCHAWPSRALCEDCVARFAQPRPRCLRCALPLTGGQNVCGACLRNPPPLDACYAAVSYTYPWSGLIADFKFHELPGWADLLAELLHSMPFVEPALEQARWILPMPLSAERLRERGYNQSWELARALVRPGGIKPQLDAQLLLRLRHTPPQAGLSRAERQRNLRDAFAVDPLRLGQLQQARVVLVDDVMTSGASLHAAALALRQAGAAHVTALVFARTDP